MKDKMKHRDALSHTSIKRIIGGKYNKVEFTKKRPDPHEEYMLYSDGWRKKKPVIKEKV